MASTKIEWADVVWNPITGCTPISEGCDHCYARRMANRLKGRAGYPADEPFRVTVHWDRIEQPMHWIKSSRIFVCSMGDLFHPDVPLNVTKDIFDVMRRAGNLYGHTFMVLTKRPHRMSEFIALLKKEKGPDFRRWPLPFVWLGVTAENQQRADERWQILSQIDAKVKFISIEPMLSEIDLRIVPCHSCNHPGEVLFWPCPYCKGFRFERPDWVICGGETGPGARPMHPDWVRALRGQCGAAKVPFFFKSYGEWSPATREFWVVGYCMPETGEKYTWIGGDGRTQNPSFHGLQDPVMAIARVGKKHAGRILDGREWNELPEGE